WVHNLIRALPTKTFRILHVGATPSEKYERKYELPPNILGIHQLFLSDFRDEHLHTRGRSPGDKKAAWETLTAFHDLLPQAPDVPLFDEIWAAIGDPKTRALSLDDLFTSHRSWDFIRERYEKKGNDTSYIDFFWTWRTTHLPLFQMLQAELPPARVYHAVSTGYAGFLASIAKKRLGVPMILTEHGIYTRERKIEIAQAEWIYVKQTEDYKIRRTQSFFKQWWINLFRMMSRLCYQEADKIITITEINQPFQLEDGADPAKMAVIPNGIKLDLYAAARPGPRSDDEFMVGFVGRVVPIKDVKTFIRSIKIAVAAVPNLKAYIIGPTDEDEEYFAECQRLTQLLNLEDVVIFTGRANVVDYYRRMHVLVLTSISEAQPLVILEGHCAGVPAVATNVGACQELLYGRTAEDRGLGPSGVVTAVASPRETADAIVQICTNAKLRGEMVEAGIRRVETFYREEDLNRTYLELHERLAEAGSRHD
ncbi:MAG TPA: GT4 family glycosyltransferase PelF, partial [Rhodothermia bacterium]|nr:GT4 family glycosyltransferase PelF [Rhodothermia bacterium]